MYVAWFLEIISCWNLKDDNLDYQSSKTLEFLYKIFNIV